MAEEILYKKLMETIQVGGHTSAQDRSQEIMPITSSTEQGQPPTNENALCAITDAATSLTCTTGDKIAQQSAVSCAEQNIKLGEMYCRMIQVRKGFINNNSKDFSFVY